MLAERSLQTVHKGETIKPAAVAGTPSPAAALQALVLSLQPSSDPLRCAS
jgi:hypothetical protein